MPAFLFKCPHCGSKEVEPTNPKIWSCKSCKKSFEEASGEEVDAEIK